MPRELVHANWETQSRGKLKLNYTWGNSVYGRFLLVIPSCWGYKQKWATLNETVFKKPVFSTYFAAGCFPDHIPRLCVMCVCVFVCVFASWYCTCGMAAFLQRESNKSSLKSTTLNPFLSFTERKIWLPGNIQSFQLSHFDLDGLHCRWVQTILTNSKPALLLVCSAAFCKEMKDKMCTRATFALIIQKWFFKPPPLKKKTRGIS